MQMDKAIQWLTRTLRSGQVKAVARATGQVIKIMRKCSTCNADKEHHEHHDEEGNRLYFCGSCDTHN